LGIAVKIYIQMPGHPVWLEPYGMQSIINWAFSVAVCVVISLITPAPAPDQVTDKLVVNWRNLNIFSDLGTHWYNSVVFWWAGFAIIILSLFLVFSGLYI